MAQIIFNKASGLNDSIYGKSAEPIYAIIEQGVEAFQEKSLIDKMFTPINSNKFAEKFTYLTSLPNFSVTGEGGNYPTDGKMQEGYSQVVEPETWKQKFEITQEMVEDNNIGLMQARARQFTLSYNRTREMFAAAMIMGGMTGTTTFGSVAHDCKSADGANLFSKAHTSITGGANQSNLFASDFSYDALCRAQEKMQMLTDDDGNLLGVSPNTIMIPNDGLLKKAVMNAIGAEGLPDTQNNSFNFQVGLWNVIVNPYLNAYCAEGIRPWFLLDTEYNEANFGGVWVDRIPLTITTDINKDNDNNIWKGRARFGAGFNDWRGYCVSYASSGGDELA